MKAITATADELNEGMLDIDGHIDMTGIVYIGHARRQPNGSWSCLANVHDALCLVEITIRLPTFGTLPSEPTYDAPCGICVCCRKRQKTNLEKKTS